MTRVSIYGKPMGSGRVKKVTDDDVLEIRSSDKTNGQLALKFKISTSHVWAIKNYRTRRGVK